VRMFAKIAIVGLVFLLVIFSILADFPVGQALKNTLDLGLYLKMISLLGLVIVAFFAWSQKRRIEASQKYRRADEVLAQAQAAYERKKQACDQMEERLKASFANKERELDDKIDQVKAECQHRLMVLKEQNVELKETVGKLMQALKIEKQRHAS
jgi:hypothetical protein